MVGHPDPTRLGSGTAGHWRTLSVLAALTTAGVVASMTIESPTDGDVFLAFVEQVLEHFHSCCIPYRSGGRTLARFEP